MPIRNSFKIFASKFSMIWSILLYVFIVGVILVSISLFALVPVYEIMSEYGIIEKSSDIITAFIINGYSSKLMQNTVDIVEMCKQLFTQEHNIVTILVLYVILVLGVLSSFLIGIMEIPIIKKFQGVLSDNGNYSFSGFFVSTIGKSALYSLVKLLVKRMSDFVFYFISYIIVAALLKNEVYILALFIFVVMFVVYCAFKYGICASWGVAIAVDGMRIFPALALSVRMFFKNFGRIFGRYIIIWSLIVLINYFVLRYTFSAGIILTIPMCILFVNIFGIIQYYEYRKYRYYVSDMIVDPSVK